MSHPVCTIHNRINMVVDVAVSAQKIHQITGIS
jgi:hypothetical protein